MEKRNIQIDIDTARKWYKIGGFYKDLALQAFNTSELEESGLPKSWETFINHSSLYNGSITRYEDKVVSLNRLLLIRDVYRQGWKPDYRNFSETKYSICLDRNVITIIKHYTGADLFSFQSEELAKQFLENFKDELEQLKELL